MYQIETHCHTAESSSCGRVKAARLVELYVDLGYDGVVITDHFSSDNSSKLLGADGRTFTFEEQVEGLMRGFRAAHAAAGDRLVVLHGFELRFDEDPNDYLVYGMTAEQLLEHPDILQWNIEKFKQYADKADVLVVHAHPFRNNMRVVAPESVHMVEIHNGHPRQQSRNAIAALWAEQHGLPGTSGSDFHEEGDEGTGGVLLPSLPRTIDEFASLMRRSPSLVVKAQGTPIG